MVNPADQSPGVARIAAASPFFRNPTDLLLEPEGTVLLVDTDADPRGWGSANGAIFRVDPQTHGVDLLAAP